MTVSQRKLAPDLWVIEAQGRLDQTLTPQFEATLNSLLADHHNDIIVDLSRTTYINSGGLRCLITARRLSRNEGGDIVLCGLNKRLTGVFEMVGLDQVLTIYGTIGEARAHFAS